MIFLVSMILKTKLIYTVWTFKDFSVIQNLREINFGEYESSKIAVFAILTFFTNKLLGDKKYYLPVAKREIIILLVKLSPGRSTYREIIILLCKLSPAGHKKYYLPVAY